MKHDNIIGQRLRKIRLAHKLTQEEMARLFFVTRSSIANYERGIRQPSYDFLCLVADYFQIDIHYLLGNTDIPVQYDLTNKMLSSTRFLTKDGNVNINSLSSFRKIMAIEFINFLRMSDEMENAPLLEDNA